MQFRFTSAMFNECETILMVDSALVLDERMYETRGNLYLRQVEFSMHNKAMPNGNSVKRPRARSILSPIKNKMCLWNFLILFRCSRI